jgi:hypothetical protein
MLGSTSFPPVDKHSSLRPPKQPAIKNGQSMVMHALLSSSLARNHQNDVTLSSIGGCPEQGYGVGDIETDDIARKRL